MVQNKKYLLLALLLVSSCSGMCDFGVDDEVVSGNVECGGTGKYKEEKETVESSHGYGAEMSEVDEILFDVWANNNESGRFFAEISYICEKGYVSKRINGQKDDAVAETIHIPASAFSSDCIKNFALKVKPGLDTESNIHRGEGACFFVEIKGNRLSVQDVGAIPPRGPGEPLEQRFFYVEEISE